MAIFLCQVLGIILLTAALMVVAIAIVLAFGSIVARYDPSGIIPMVLAYLAPLCLGWWLYAKALRRFASRLNLAVPSRTLGIPLVGEIRVIAAMVSRR